MCKHSSLIALSRLSERSRGEMANIRSTLPSRLRQLLSGETDIGPSIKLDSEPGNFHHWRPLFLHFDTYFKTYVSCRNDLLLSEKILEDDSPFPKHSVLQILRVMQMILENCHNKSSFDGLENFKFLLSSTDPEVLIATLETLSALVKINPSKVHGSGMGEQGGGLGSIFMRFGK
ncbi:E3 ubiquitin-protein ligase UPL2 -like protein [Gossypium arboreum]|uniref:E3 ubiquitin-protein ligase UPL2-like protein n=1 Tax=Gossypium arboreum TaxID=29729 RepID=A0A0B0Q012_GOSAR|nr:E3 ubiquitin-protein ligase UPL2 -like protein [Gossypium arboreum]